MLFYKNKSKKIICKFGLFYLIWRTNNKRAHTFNQSMQTIQQIWKHKTSKHNSKTKKRNSENKIKSNEIISHYKKTYFENKIIKKKQRYTFYELHLTQNCIIVSIKPCVTCMIHIKHITFNQNETQTQTQTTRKYTQQKY